MLDEKTLAASVYDDLRKAIVTGELLPGVRLNEMALSQRFTVSRTPIREALRRLERDGLVETEPRRGTSVTQISRQDVLDAFEARSWIEPPLFAKAASVIDSDTLAALRATVDDMPAHPKSRLEAMASIAEDLKFHEIVAVLAGNRFMTRALMDMLSATRRAIHFSPPSRFVLARQEHLKLLAALQEHDSEMAARLVRQHIANARKRFGGGYDE